MAGKTDLRWSDREWAALAGYADGRGLSPGRAVKAIVLERLRVGPPAAYEAVQVKGPPVPNVGRLSGVGPAAPEGRESGVHDPAVPRSPAPSRPAGIEAVLAANVEHPGGSLRDVERTTGGGEKLLREHLERPVGSAGSAVPVPPAGVAAPVVAPPPAAGAPELSLLEAAAGALRARGMAGSQALLLARKAIVGGQVVVDGEVCRDPGRLVDPGSLGVG